MGPVKHFLLKHTCLPHYHSVAWFRAETLNQPAWTKRAGISYWTLLSLSFPDWNRGQEPHSEGLWGSRMRQGSLWYSAWCTAVNKENKEYYYCCYFLHFDPDYYLIISVLWKNSEKLFATQRLLEANTLKGKKIPSPTLVIMKTRPRAPGLMKSHESSIPRPKKPNLALLKSLVFPLPPRTQRLRNLLFFFDCPGAGDDWVAEVLGWSSSSFVSVFNSVPLSSVSVGSTLQSSALV